MGFNFLSLFKALPVVWRFRPDLLFDRVAPFGFTGLALSVLTGVPLVAHVDAPFEVERSYRGQSIASGLNQWILKCVAHRARVVLVGSEIAREHHIANGLPANKVMVFHNGVFGSELQHDASEKATDDGVPVVIGFVGSMAKWHRVDYLIEAFARVCQSGRVTQPLELRLVGMGEEYDRTQELVRDLRLSDCVKFLGPLPHAQTLQQVDGFDIAVLPNTLTTGSPMKLFEYAARCAAIVAPDLPNLRQIFSSDEVCFFPQHDVDALASTLLKLIQDPGARKSLAQRARDRVARQYTWEKQMARVLDHPNG